MLGRRVDGKWDSHLTLSNIAVILNPEQTMITRFTHAALFLLLATLATSCFAQSKPAAPVTAAEPLAPIAWLVGGTWVSDVKDPSDGSVTHVENRIRWARNKQAIGFNADFNGKPHYYGFYAYNPVAKTIGFYYTNSEGELTIGTATPDADGKTLHQEFDIMHTNGKTGRRCSRFGMSGSKPICRCYNCV